MRYSEKYLERKLSQQVKAKGGLCLKLLPFEFTGLSDRLILLPGGRLLFVEVKTTGKKPNKRQLYVIRKLQMLRFRVEVVDNLEQINEIINEY